MGFSVIFFCRPMYPDYAILGLFWQKNHIKNFSSDSIDQMKKKPNWTVSVSPVFIQEGCCYLKAVENHFGNWPLLLYLKSQWAQNYLTSVYCLPTKWPPLLKIAWKKFDNYRLIFFCQNELKFKMKQQDKSVVQHFELISQDFCSVDLYWLCKLSLFWWKKSH